MDTDSMPLADFLRENKLQLNIHYVIDTIYGYPLWRASIAPMDSDFSCKIPDYKADSMFDISPATAVNKLIKFIEGKKIKLWSESNGLGMGGYVKDIEVPTKLMDYFV